MKKMLVLSAAVAAFTALADFPSPMPQNTLKLAIKQAVAEAKAYTDAKIAGGSGSSSNEVAAIKADVDELKVKVAAAPTAEDVATVAETAGEAKGTATANSELIAGLTTTVAGKLDKTTADSTYQPKGPYLESESDPSVPAWAKESNKPSYDATEITYNNGFLSTYLVELVGQIPTVPTKLSAFENDSGYLTQHQDISGKADASNVYTKREIDSTFETVERNLAAKADSNAVYTKAEADAKFLTEHQDLSAFNAKIREALARIKILEKSYVPAEGVTGIVAQAGQAVTVNDATTDAVIGGTVDTGVMTLTAKSVDIDNLSAAPKYAANGVGITVTSPTVSVSDSEIVGPTQQSSNLIEAHDVNTMTIKDTTFTGSTYNTVMTGQRTTDYLSELTIENCVFNEDCKHVNVWFAGFKDDAVLNIKNCTFKTCEQFLCISDFSGADKKLTINLENVDILNYEKSADGTTPDEYEGIILFDDRVCNDDAGFVAAAPFKNVTLNLTNCTAGGVALTADTFKVGTGAPGQMLYLYCAKARKTYRLGADTKALFPKIVVNGTTVVNPAE